jgi:hypothetical protein
MAVSETRFEALGQAWRFKFGFGAICSLEQMFDLPFAQVIERVLPNLSAADVDDPEKVAAAVSGIRMTDLRSVLIAGLGVDVTEETAADIMDELGFERVMGILSDAIATDVQGAKGGRGGPPPKKAGRGRRS